MSSWDRRRPILAFFCNWAPYLCFMNLGKSGLSLPYPIHPIKVMCAGRVDPAMLLHAFEKGAEGVMVVGCKDKECPYGPGPQQAKKMEERMGGLMHVLGLEPERFSSVYCASHDMERLYADMNSFAKKIGKLGKSPVVRQLL